MKNKLLFYQGILTIHHVILAVFLIWYFWLKGYLGHGFGELIYILIVLVVTIGSIPLFIHSRKIVFTGFQGVVYFGLMVIYLFFISVLCAE